MSVSEHRHDGDRAVGSGPKGRLLAVVRTLSRPYPGRSQRPRQSQSIRGGWIPERGKGGRRPAHCRDAVDAMGESRVLKRRLQAHIPLPRASGRDGRHGLPSTAAESRRAVCARIAAGQRQHASWERLGELVGVCCRRLASQPACPSHGEVRQQLNSTPAARNRPRRDLTGRELGGESRQSKSTRPCSVVIQGREPGGWEPVMAGTRVPASTPAPTQLGQGEGGESSGDDCG